MSRAAQKPRNQAAGAKAKRAKRPKEPVQTHEPVSQVTIKMRESLHRELARKAFKNLHLESAMCRNARKPVWLCLRL